MRAVTSLGFSGAHETRLGFQWWWHIRPRLSERRSQSIAKLAVEICRPDLHVGTVRNSVREVGFFIG